MMGGKRNRRKYRHRISAPFTRKAPRCGSLLLLVLMTGTIIAVISLGALIVQGVYLDQSTAMNDATRSRWAARSGVALASREISVATEWRTTRKPGVWYSDVVLNSGKWSLSASDPTDTSFSDSTSEPVLMSATGQFGDAIQKNSGLCLTESVLRQPMMFHACCGDDLMLDNAAVEGSGWIGARDKLSVSGTNSVSCDVMTGRTFSGSGLLHRTVTEARIDSPPAFSDFGELVSLGTAVASASVPTATPSTAETILNEDFNRGDVGWQALPSGSLTINSNGGSGNSDCVTVTGRTGSSDGITHDVTGILRNGLQTQLSAEVLPLSSATPFEMSLIVTTTGGTSTAASWTSAPINSGSLYLSIQVIAATVTPTWSGRLISAQLKIRTSGGGAAGTQSFLVDNVSLKVSSAPSGKAIHRKVVSTATNPFGVTSNSYGIYVLDLAGADLTISDSMIVGTLIIQNAGTVRVGNGPVQWRPAKPGMPALVVDGDIELTFSRFALTERELGANFNPSGTRDENGRDDSNLNDSYLPGIRGLVFASDDITLAGDVRLDGCLLAGDDMTIRQRAVFDRAPQLFTVMRQSTHVTESFLRETTGVTRSFD